MKNRLYFLLILSFVVMADLHAQNTMGTQTQAVDFNGYPLGTIETFDKRDNSLVGEPYLKETPMAIQIITTYNDTISLNRAKYNLLGKQIEFMDGEFNKFLSAKYLNQVKLFDPANTCYCHDFIVLKNVEDLENELVEVIQDSDEFIFGNLHYAVIDKANYNAALDMGEPRDKLDTRTKLILIKDNQAFDLDVSKRKFSRYFKQSKKVFKELKAKDYSYTNPIDLFKILNKFELEI